MEVCVYRRGERKKENSEKETLKKGKERIRGKNRAVLTGNGKGGKKEKQERWERNIKRETEIREREYLFATHECTAALPWKRQPLGL